MFWFHVWSVTAQLGNKKEGDYVVDHCRVFFRKMEEAQSVMMEISFMVIQV